MHYKTVRQAVADRRCITAVYDAQICHFAPHVIGQGPDGSDAVLGFRYAAKNGSPVPADGDWECFRIEGLTFVSINADLWHTRRDKGLPDGCVTKVDLKVAW